MTPPKPNEIYINPVHGRKIVLTATLEGQIACGLDALECIADLLCPVEDGVDLHMVNRGQLSHLVGLVHETLARAIEEANIR